MGMTTAISRHNGPMADLVVDAPELSAHAWPVQDEPGVWEYTICEHHINPDDWDVFPISFVECQFAQLATSIRDASDEWEDVDPDDIVTIYIHRGDYTPVQRVEP